MGSDVTYAWDVDVLVVGGGTAGTVAAIAAGRTGASVALLEMGSQLGGVTTTGGVSFPGLFHAWGRPIIAGIGWELVTEAVRLDGGRLPDFTRVPERHWMHQVRINPGVYASLAEEACAAAAVRLCYYEIPRTVERTPAGWTMTSVGKGLTRTVRCRQLIDCTGGADVVGQIGLPRRREAETQPGTQIFRFGGCDVDSLNADVIQSAYEAALADGRLQPGDVRNRNARFVGFLRSGGENAQHIYDADSSTAATKTRANIAGRASMLRLLRFIRSLPGCEEARLEMMAPEAGIRETYRIVGEAEVTHADYVAGRHFEDAVCYSFYPIDLHDRDGVKPKPLSPGVVPTVPLRALIPKGCPNLLVAGRSVSSDRLANSALRVQACCMAMGQAAGSAAALAAREGASPGEVPFDVLAAALKREGAIVPDGRFGPG
jgi:hypothetical protein